jgi:hypothetical protein
MEQRMDRSKPLWDFHLVQNYTKDTSVLFLRMHHSFTDGVGYVCLMSFLNDEKFNTKTAKKIPEPTFFQNALLWATMPFVVLYTTYKASKIKTDDQAAKIRELKGGDDFKTKLYASEQLFSFEALRK